MMEPWSVSWAVTHACNLSTLEGEPALSHVGHNEFQASLGQSESLSQKKNKNKQKPY